MGQRSSSSTAAGGSVSAAVCWTGVAAEEEDDGAELRVRSAWLEGRLSVEEDGDGDGFAEEGGGDLVMRPAAGLWRLARRLLVARVSLAIALWFGENFICLIFFFLLFMSVVDQNQDPWGFALSADSAMVTKAGL